MADQTERQLKQFPDFDDLESVECKDIFKIYRDPEEAGFYRFFFYGNFNWDHINLAKKCPSLAETLVAGGSYPHGSAFSFMDDKLVAFDLPNIEYFILDRHGHGIRPWVIELCEELGGQDKQDGWYSGDIIYFEVKCNRSFATRYYGLITKSKCGQEMDERCWKFEWHDLPGGLEPRFVVFERIPEEAGYVSDLPITRQRLIELCPDCLSVDYDTELQLCSDAVGKKLYVIIPTDSVGNVCVPLDPEKYYAVFPKGK